MTLPRFYLLDTANFDEADAVLTPGSAGRTHVTIGPKVIATFATSNDAAEWLYGYDDGPTGPYCDHDVPGGCSNCRNAWNVHAAIDAMTDAERSDYLYDGGTFETFFAPYGPAFQRGL